ncbi:hypothetical protein RYX36_016182 [Vicia faba]
MSFIGTQLKCKACEKTIYPVDQLSADGTSYHKACFRCTHYKGTLKLSNYSSMEGVLYCKPHFEQLFKEHGNFSKNFQSPATTSSPNPFNHHHLTSPSSSLAHEPSDPFLIINVRNEATAMSFIGTQLKCKACEKTVYPVDQLSADGTSYHKACFRCTHCKGTLKLSNYSSMEGVLYCKPHFEQLFKEHGNFSKNFQSPATTSSPNPFNHHHLTSPSSSLAHEPSDPFLIINVRNVIHHHHLRSSPKTSPFCNETEAASTHLRAIPIATLQLVNLIIST